MAEYNTVDGYRNIYNSSYSNLSGTVGHITEYSYDENTKQCIQSYQVAYDTYGQGGLDCVKISEIENPAAMRVAKNKNQDPDPDVRLLFDAYGLSDYPGMTYDEAIEYLGNAAG